MATEKRLIEIIECLEHCADNTNCERCSRWLYHCDDHCVDDLLATAAKELRKFVDAVPVDEIRVDIMSLCLENQEAILNVSICGKPNEVKLPFSKEIAEVVHGRWIEYKSFMQCSECGSHWYYTDNDCHLFDYCPNCGAMMYQEDDNAE